VLVGAVQPGIGVRMERQDGIAVRVEHALAAGRVLRWLGWSVGALGILGTIGFIILWAVGELDVDQGVSLILGTALATVLSGATAYGSGVNLGLGAARLDIAANDTGVTGRETDAASPAGSHGPGPRAR
jgi:hypothetical protein